MVSPGPNPLPVAIHVKSDQKHGSIFYFLDQESRYANNIESALYEDPVQEAVRTVIQRALIKTFGLFTWKLDQDTGKYFPNLPLPYDGCIYKVIDAVKKEISRYNLEYTNDTEKLEQTGAHVKGRKNVADRLPHIWGRNSPGFVTRLLLNLTSTFAVFKNWNSHGAIVGAALCQLGSVLGSLESGAIGPLIDTEFQQVIPLGNALTGQKHGHSETVYVEYMVSVAEEVIGSGEDCNYLDHATFCWNRHDDKVREIFDKKVEGYSCPAPRATRAHTFDFNLSFRGATLIDGKCKDTASKADEGVLVFHSADQFGYKDSSLLMLATSTGIKFFKSHKDSRAGTMKTIFYETRKYKLGPITQALCRINMLVMTNCNCL